MTPRPIALAAALLLALSACSSNNTGTAEANNTSESTPSKTTPSEPAADLTITGLSKDGVPTLDASAINGLTWHEVGKEGKWFRRVSWIVIPGAEALNSALAQRGQAAADGFDKLYPGTAASTSSLPQGAKGTVALAAIPQPAHPQLNFTTGLIASSADLTGVRIDEVSATREGFTRTLDTTYYDATSKQVHAGKDLFTADGQTAFTKAVQAALTAGKIDVSAADAGKVTAEQALRAVTFRADGTVVAELSQGVIKDRGVIAVPIAKADAAKWLSPLGKSAQAAAAKPPATTKPTGVDCMVEKCVAITYDDGPFPWTATLLDTLKEKNVKATFYLVGGMAKARPELVKREVAEGHEVGGHSMTHGGMVSMSPSKLDYEIDQPDAYIKAALGKEPTTMRPPYGSSNERVDKVIGSRKLQIIDWDADSADWQHDNADKTVQAAQDKVQPGSIMLMHDLHKSSVAAAPRVVDVLVKEGYKLVTVSELLAGTNPQDGVPIYYRPGSPSELTYGT